MRIGLKRRAFQLKTRGEDWISPLNLVAQEGAADLLQKKKKLKPCADEKHRQAKRSREQKNKSMKDKCPNGIKRQHSTARRSSRDRRSERTLGADELTTIRVGLIAEAAQV